MVDATVSVLDATVSDCVVVDVDATVVEDKTVDGDMVDVTPPVEVGSEVTAGVMVVESLLGIVVVSRVVVMTRSVDAPVVTN